MVCDEISLNVTPRLTAVLLNFTSEILNLLSILWWFCLVALPHDMTWCRQQKDKRWPEIVCRAGQHLLLSIVCGTSASDCDLRFARKVH